METIHQQTPTTPKRLQASSPFKPLFFAALVVVAALAALCIWLVVRQQSSPAQGEDLDAKVAQLEQELSQQKDAYAQQQQAMEQQKAQLDEAKGTIDELQKHAFATPDGKTPEYTTLYPDFYVPAWEGERIDGGNVCCLTFDDGPSENTDRVLEILDRYGVKATFFVIGRTGEEAQARMRRIVEAGHTLAMHSWSHDYSSVYSSVEGFLEEFYNLYQWIYDVTGVYPSVFRFPGGSINSYNRQIYMEIIAEMTRRGFVYYDWNASAQDATRDPRPAGDIAADCLKGIGQDIVVALAHDSAARATTVDALPAVIEGYKNAGYTFSALHPGVLPVNMGYPRVQ